jgi:hypothetical protein
MERRFSIGFRGDAEPQVIPAAKPIKNRRSAENFFKLVGSTYSHFFTRSKKLNHRLANYAGIFHALAQFRRFHKRPHFRPARKTANDRQIIRRTRAAKDAKTLFTRFFAPIRAGFHGALPFGVVGDFMADEYN